LSLDHPQMPRVTPISPTLSSLIDEQDGVVTVDQLVTNGFQRGTAFRRMSEGPWQSLLPGVGLVERGRPTRRQLMIAAWLWAGPSSAIDASCACNWYGVKTSPASPEIVHVVVPWPSNRKSRDFVVVRSSMAEISIGGRGAVPYVDAPTAFVVAARNARSPRAAISVLSRALQENIVSTRELLVARERLGDKLCRPVDAALLAVDVGVRSPAEEDARRLLMTSRRLPPIRWNQWLDLGDGGYPVCVDGLIEDAGLVHEINGKRYHAWDKSFEDMHSRHERIGATGIVVVPSTPLRIRRSGPQVLANVERTYEFHAGRGMPPGVRLIDPPDHFPHRAL
jgi:hypothetical protein